MMATPATREYERQSPLDFAQFDSLKQNEQEKYLRELSSKIIENASLKMKEVQPFHEIVKRITNIRLPENSSKLNSGILSLIRIECEFYGKGVKRALQFASEHLQGLIKEDTYKEAFEGGNSFIELIDEGYASAMNAREALTDILGMDLNGHISEFPVDINVQKALRFYIDRSAFCCRRAMIEYGILAGALKSIWQHLKTLLKNFKKDNVSLGNFAFLKYIERQSQIYERITNDITEGMMFLTQVGEYTPHLKFILDSKETLSDIERQALMDREWPEKMAKLIKKYSDIEKGMDRLREQPTKKRIEKFLK